MIFFLGEIGLAPDCQRFGIRLLTNAALCYTCGFGRVVL